MRISACGLAALLWAVSLAAQSDLPIHKKTLPNGLDVIVVENHAVPLVTVELDVKNGAFTEPPEFDGLSHLSPERNAGFSHANPQRLYLPVVIDPEYHYQTVNVETQQSNPHSLLWWMKRLIALRKRHQAFGRAGNLRKVAGNMLLNNLYFFSF